MLATILDRVLQASTEGPGMSAAQHARAVFAERGGPFADGDPFFEERTQAFLDWFVLGYRDASGRTTAERYLDAHPALTGAEREAVVALCRSMRGLFRMDGVSGGLVHCTDLLGGAAFAAEPLGDPTGLGPGSIADGHVIPYRGGVALCRGLVFHPPEAAPSIKTLVPAALAAGVGREELLFALLRMRVRLDHYRGIRADKVYRFPFRSFP